MKISSKIRRAAIPGILGIASVFALIAWSGNPGGGAGYFQDRNDTVPKSKKLSGDKKLRDFEKELQQLEKAEQDLLKAEQIDFDQIQRDIEKSLQNIDFEKAQLEIQRVEHQENLEKMMEDLQESLGHMELPDFDIDLDDLEELDAEERAEVHREMLRAKEEVRKSFDRDEFRREMERAREEMEQIDFEEIHESMEDVKEEMDKVREEMSSEKFNMRAELDKARIEIKEAREELKGYQQMVEQMDKEGLIDTDNNYSIELRNGKLFLNGKEQSQEVLNRYKKFFKKDNISIRKTDNGMQVEHDHDGSY